MNNMIAFVIGYMIACLIIGAISYLLYRRYAGMCECCITKMED